jgi:class 3 adenylate cyclase
MPSSTAPPRPPDLEAQFAAFEHSLLSSVRDQVFAAAGGDNRVLTVLFVDLSGSVAATAQLDPEETRDRLDAVLKVMVDAILRYQG